MTRTLQFCGFGGQGIILSSVILGTAAVTKAGLYAVQTQSYGSESRGGECQAQVIVSETPVDSPVADQSDVLVAMSQAACDRYIGRLKTGGLLIYDPELVNPHGAPPGVRMHAVPATRTAAALGNTLAANMVMLGFVQGATGMLSGDALCAAIQDSVRARFVELNLNAARRGMALAASGGSTGEV